MPKVSVIIPVYKVERYLPECLASMNRQSFTDFELILVDDGSPDDCGKMCDEYAKSHPNTKVIHQPNGGPSNAKNNGVAASVGEYIIFADSDDYVTDDYIQYLYGLITEFDADVAVGWRAKFFDGQSPTLTKKEILKKRLDPAEALTLLCYGKISIHPWGKIYKRHLVEQFPYPEGVLYEDIATTHKIFGASRAIAYSNKVLYFWRQRKQSITHELVTERHLEGITATEKQLAYIQEHYPTAVPAAQVRCVKKIVDTAHRVVMGDGNREYFRELQTRLRPFVKTVLKDKQLVYSIKIRMLALDIGYLPFLLVSKMYSKIKDDSV